MNWIVQATIFTVLTTIAFVLNVMTIKEPVGVVLFTGLISILCFFIAFATSTSITERIYLNTYTKFFAMVEQRNIIGRANVRLSRTSYEAFCDLCNLKEYAHYDRSYNSESEFASDMVFPLKRMIRDIEYINDIGFKNIKSEYGLYPSVTSEDRYVQQRRLKYFYENVKAPHLKQQLEVMLDIRHVQAPPVEQQPKIVNHLEGEGDINA